MITSIDKTLRIIFDLLNGIGISLPTRRIAFWSTVIMSLRYGINRKRISLAYRFNALILEYSDNVTVLRHQP